MKDRPSGTWVLAGEEGVKYDKEAGAYSGKAESRRDISRWCCEPRLVARKLRRFRGLQFEITQPAHRFGAQFRIIGYKIQKRAVVVSGLVVTVCND